MTDKLLWTEGLFIRPHHFQKQDDNTEALLERRVRTLVSYGWGITRLVIDVELLALGKIAIRELTGVFPDGTPVQIPECAAPPVVLDVPADAKGRAVFIALPLKISEKSMTRYLKEQRRVQDHYSPRSTDAVVDFLKPRLTLVLEGEHVGDYAALPICRVKEVIASGKVELDSTHIAPLLDCNADGQLYGYIKEIAGLLRNRGETMAGTAVSSGHSGIGEVKDLMWLQVINRYEPLFLHFQDVDRIHPERLFSECVMLAGELATFASDEKRPVAFPSYDHNNLRATFFPVIEELRKLLSVVVDPNVFHVPLDYRGPGRGVGLYVAPMRELSGHINLRELVEIADFYLGVKVDLPAEILHQEFPQQVKVGPVESIERMVNINLGGVKIAFTQVPRQIPYHNGFTYYALQQGSRHWQELGFSNGLAVYLGEKYQDVQLELWAVKR